MNYRLILKLIGHVIRYEAAFMSLSLIVAFLNKEDPTSILIALAISLTFSLLLSFIKPKNDNFRTIEGFVSVSLSWISLAVFGALPFYFSGYFNSYVDCIFEAISGFTTTGASILSEVEHLPKSILFWRSFTHWIGGMGVLVFVLAIMPSMTASSVNLLKAESPGPTPSKIVPKIRHTAIIMYIIYFTLTVINIILYKIAGLSIFDSFIHAFGTAGTGGFSSMNGSIGSYNNVAVEVITTIFMFLFGINFTLYFYFLKKDFKNFFKDEELIFYFSIVILATLLISFNISKEYGSFKEAIRHASFQVSTIITTTGYSSTDFNLWPNFSKTIIVILMLMGCCAGSTGGGIKIIRILTMIKAVRIEIFRLLHPRVVKNVKINGKKIDEPIIAKIFMFFCIYFFILCISTLIVSIDGEDLTTNVTAVISALSNIGPGLMKVGPMSNFGFYSNLSKLVLSFCMLAGRLEFFPILILFSPSIWRKGSLN